ncbi:hypothetical protein C1646_670503 [Rhizophagus diaphanus]|nr:hypothetical protein C1646_670503 [Rhizophagus diaphanus] [Rhizophagus sp. MUCL 43196]
MFDSVNSIWRLRSALEKVVNEHGSIVTNKTVTKIITARGFFHDTNLVLKVLEPLKKAILSVEASNTNYADCFIALVRLADAIKKISIERGLISFQTHTINSINERWNSFDIMPLILTYFLHPGYHGTCLIMNKYTYSLANKVHLYFILGAGLKLGMWTKISNYAQNIWKNMGYSVVDQEILVAQMLNFKEKQGTYATPFTKTYRITPRTWWISCEDMPPFVKNLALKIFAVTPHSASCERKISALSWLYGKRRTSLDITTIESMAKIRHFYQNSPKHKENDQTDSEIHNLVNEFFYFEDSDNNYDDDNNEDESGYEEIIEDQIPNHEVYVLIEDYFDSAILENDMFEEEEEDL